MFELRYDATIKAVLDSLPHLAREEFRDAMRKVVQDPYGTTVPYGVDDGVTRHLVLPRTMAVLLVTRSLFRVRILQITHLEAR